MSLQFDDFDLKMSLTKIITPCADINVSMAPKMDDIIVYTKEIKHYPAAKLIVNTIQLHYQKGDALCYQSSNHKDDIK